MERKTYMLNGHSMSLKTTGDIKWYHLEKNPDSHFFDRETMLFFGDTMGNFGVYWDENGYRCIYRKKPVKNGLRGGFRLRDEDGDLMPIRK
jgi:hypothetical protein